ncbi:electron transport complex subunit RsxD [Gallaecimonas xiamenensis]|uniref:Ion-translocating oxidoreductase complex subunit D n=1 Tax=Gallaecimonas xiamenensis 3-C-1 TaxID=745411 RepID=K2J2A6_9GAMM|nr:RnfD-related protein [Gallaecimonas xiamenensis 3-C-1]
MLIASSPHTHKRRTTGQVMRLVAYATLPGAAALVYFFGYGVLINLALCSLTALVTEALVLLLRGKSLWQLADSSALLTAILLALALPPTAPWWLLVIGSVFAILVAKQLYGGIGQNLFNPAMAAYVLLLISFPVQMTNWLPAKGLASHSPSFQDSLSLTFSGYTTDGFAAHQLSQGVDGVTQATPLDTLKTDLKQGLTASESMTKALFADIGGKGWNWVNLGFLLGGLFLLWRGIIDWQIPGGVLGGLLLASLLGFILHPDGNGSPLFHLFSGAAMFGAFFIATDPVTAATSPKGRLIFGLLIGVLTYLIRVFGGYPDAIAFAVLLANMTAPLLDNYTRPNSFGEGSKP